MLEVILVSLTTMERSKDRKKTILRIVLRNPHILPKFYTVRALIFDAEGEIHEYVKHGIIWDTDVIVFEDNYLAEKAKVKITQGLLKKTVFFKTIPALKK